MKEEILLKKITCLLLSGITALSLLSGCGEDVATDDYSDYKNSLNNFFDAVTTLDEEINALDPEDDDSISELFVYLDELEDQFEYFAEIEVPDAYIVTESLADEAYDYMKQANEYFKASFSDTSYNQYTYEAGLECYSRANKRVQYVISILHGELPEDENISYE